MKRFRALTVILSIAVMLVACVVGEEAAPPPVPTIADSLTPTSEPIPPATQASSIPSTTNKTTSGRMSEDETWHGEILITGDIEIPQGVILTIEPGTTIRFTAQSDDQHGEEEYSPEDPSTMHATMISILVFGELDAQGMPDQPIVFTSDSEAPGQMDWQSITVEGSGTVRLEHVTIEHGFFGLQLNSPMLHVAVSQSTFQDITTCAICAEGARPLEGPVIISDSQFIRCGRESIDTYRDQNIVVHHNVFSENYVGIMSVGSSITIEGNLFINNERGIGVVEGGTPDIIGNEFTQHQGAAIFVTDASPTVSNNNIYENLFNFQMEGGSQNAVAANNWWGSADPKVIGDSIQDGRDDPSLGIVDFEPYANEAFQLDIPEYE